MEGNGLLAAGILAAWQPFRLQQPCRTLHEGQQLANSQSNFEILDHLQNS